MDYDDRYHPSNSNDVDKKYNGVGFMDDLKKLDPGYNEIYRRVLQDNDKVKNKKIVVYSSGSLGSQIRNAVTGFYTKDIVGSSDEDLYFSCILATGELRKGSVTLFFDSPEQCEKHLYQLFGEDTKSKWNTKRSKNLR